MLERLKSKLENVSLSPLSWLIGFTGICMVRFFLEALSSPTSSGMGATDASTLLHYLLFFITVALATLLVLYWALLSWRLVLPQFLVSVFAIIFLAPLIDFAVSQGLGFHMSYLFQDPKTLLHSFLTYFGPDWQTGITIGIRIELLLILLFTGVIIYREARSLLRALGFVIVLYTIMFLFVSLPSVVALWSGVDPVDFFVHAVLTSATAHNNLHTTLVYGSEIRLVEIGFNFVVSKILFLILLSLGSVYFFLRWKEKFLAVIKNSRPERVLAYFSVIALGILLSFSISPPLSSNWTDILSVVTLLFSFYFSWIFAVCVNDIVDIDIDRVSNPERPLTSGILSVWDLKQAAYLSLFLSLVAGYLSGFYALFCVLTFTALYYIYSAPPTRFKQIPFFASFLIGLCTLSAFIAGFFIFSQTKVFTSLPSTAISGIVIFFTLFVHLRDLKDITGDREAGIMTPAVLFGEKFVGVLVALAYVLIPLLVHVLSLYVVMLPAACLSYYFCVRKPYTERPLFLIYFVAYLLSIVFFLLFI